MRADDEDGVTTVAVLTAGATESFTITVNSSAPTTVGYGLWIDFTAGGVFDAFYSGSVTTSSPTDVVVAVPVPSGWQGNAYYRVRVFADGYVPTMADSAGTFVNGEVEDYVIGTPTTVTLRDAGAVNGDAITRVALLVSIVVMTLVTVRVVRRREQN